VVHATQEEEGEVTDITSLSLFATVIIIVITVTL